MENLHVLEKKDIVRQKNEEGFVPLIDSKKFSFVINKLRTFFLDKGFVEVHTQNRLSIMAACEDPHTIATYNYNGELWPLPQTGQMWLEHELLENPSWPGVFCVSTSYRNEPNPVKGRHHRIFPMFEFESHGDFEDLKVLCAELVDYLGFGNAEDFIHGDYEAVAKYYNVDILENEHEKELEQEHGSIFFLENFPERTSPFWNMMRDDKNPNIAHKLDVLMHGMETIGSAERSNNANEQREAFYTIENGKYAQKIFDLFGKERVEAELENFLNKDFFPRVGGGIGVTSMMRAMELSNLMK
jgi:aspartyl/asparaginyl-tRNA synthetase